MTFSKIEKLKIGKIIIENKSRPILKSPEKVFQYSQFMSQAACDEVSNCYRQRFSESVWYCQVYLGHLRLDLSSLISRRDFLQMAILVSLAFAEVILDMWSMFTLHPIWHQLPLLLITITT